MADSSTVQAVWTTFDWFQVVGLGALAGAIGQGIRTIVGMKKLNDTPIGFIDAVVQSNS